MNCFFTDDFHDQLFRQRDLAVHEQTMTTACRYFLLMIFMTSFVAYVAITSIAAVGLNIAYTLPTFFKVKFKILIILEQIITITIVTITIIIIGI